MGVVKGLDEVDRAISVSRDLVGATYRDMITNSFIYSLLLPRDRS